MNEQRLTNDPAEDIAPIFPELEYGYTHEDLKSHAARFDCLTEITDRGIYDQVRAAIAELRKTRVAIDDKRKALGLDAMEFKRKVDAKGKELIALLEPQEARLKALKEAVDAEKRSEREAKEATERGRISDIHALMDEMRKLPTKHMRSPSAEVEAVMETLKSSDMTEEVFQEFLPRAQDVRSEVLIELEELREGALHDERLDEKRKGEAEELEKQKAEFEEQQRKATEAENSRREANEKILADERAELDKERQEIAAAQQKEADAKTAAEEHERQVKLDKEAKARAKRLAPDKDKLLEFAVLLITYDDPDVQSEEAKQILTDTAVGLVALHDAVMDSVSSL